MIRKANLSEIDKIITITRACAQKMNAEGIIQWNDTYPNKDIFFKDFRREELYVLHENTTIIGCITISSEKDDEYNTVSWSTHEGLHYYIHRLAIDPNYQHRGYAKYLMDFAETFAKQKNALSIRLDTFSKNRRNQRFYTARGYQQLEAVYFPQQSPFPFYCYELVL